MEKLDGIPGWLTQFGYTHSNNPRSSESSLKKSLSEASKIIKDELENISKSSSGMEEAALNLKRDRKGTKEVH